MMRMPVPLIIMADHVDPVKTAAKVRRAAVRDKSISSPPVQSLLVSGLRVRRSGRRLIGRWR